MPDAIQNSKSGIQNFPDPVALALAEDIGSGDLTCAYFVDAARSGKARIFAKQPCVLAGTHTAAGAFALVDATLAVRATSADFCGSSVRKAKAGSSPRSPKARATFRH